MKDNRILDDKRKHRTVKRQTELAVLSYVEYLAGLKVKGRRMRGGGSRVNVRKEIMRYFFHPRVGYLEIINKALKLADFYSIKSVRSNHLTSLLQGYVKLSLHKLCKALLRFP